MVNQNDYEKRKPKSGSGDNGWEKKGAGTESEKPERAEIFVDVWYQDRTQDSGQKLILM